MSTPTTNVEIAEFLAHNAWLRRLVTRLVAPEHVDDVVQDTFVQLTSHPPRHSKSPRGWLAQVARNTLRMRARGDVRRHAREVAADDPATAPDPETVVVRMQRLRVLLRLVEQLEEPFRSTVLLHYFEGLSLAEIARRTDTPGGTVRWRLQAGLQKLRARLDEEYDGSREVWLSAFAPLGTTPDGVFREAVTGVSVNTTKKFIVAAAILGTVGIAAATSAGGAPVAGMSSPPIAEPREPPGGPPVVDAPIRPEHVSDDTAMRPAVTPASPKLAPVPAPRIPLVAPEQPLGDPATLVELRRERLLDFVDEGSSMLPTAEPQLLTDLEELVWLDQSFEAGKACEEESPPEVKSILYVEVEFRGLPNFRSTVELVTIDTERSDTGFGEFARCIERRLLDLPLVPMALDETRLLNIYFDTTGAEIELGIDSDANPP